MTIHNFGLEEPPQYRQHLELQKALRRLHPQNSAAYLDALENAGRGEDA